MLAPYGVMHGKQKKNANVLRFTPPGFKHPIDVPFPGRCLPVCERCKKNFKTREHCRTRDCHTGLPWSDTFLCITLDSSCTNEDNKLLDGPFMAKPVTSQPYCLQGEIDPKTPICAPCKDKNYTRTYCRNNKKHRQLPWSTVYVVLSLRPDGMYPEPQMNEKQGPAKRRKTNDSTSAASESSPSKEDAAKDEKEKEKPSTTTKTPATTEGEKSKEEKPETKKEKDDDEEDQEEEERSKFEDIPRSRTFLTTVSAKACSIDWLDVDPMIQQVMSRKDEQAGRMADEGYGSPYGGMMSHGHGGMNFPGKEGRGNMPPPDQMMGGRGFPGRGGFPGSDMMGGHFEGPSHMSPRGGMGNYSGYSAQEMMNFESLNMPRVPRHGGEMGQGHFDGPPMMGRMGGWGGFNQQEMMHFDRMRGGPGQDMLPSQLPPHMWPMAGPFVGRGGGPHGGNGNYNEGGNGHEGGYGGPGGYPSHGREGGNMMGGGEGGGQGGPPGPPPPPPPAPQDSEGGDEKEQPTNA